MFLCWSCLDTFTCDKVGPGDGKNINETGSARVVPRVYRNRDGEVDATGGPRRIEGRLGRASWDERYLRKLLLRRRRALPGAHERPRGPLEFLESFAAVSSVFETRERRLSRVFVSYKRGGTRRVVLHPNSRTGGTASAGFNHRGGSTLSVLQCRSRRRRSRTKGEVPVRAWVLNGVEGRASV